MRGMYKHASQLLKVSRVHAVLLALFGNRAETLSLMIYWKQLLGAVDREGIANWTGLTLTLSEAKQQLTHIDYF